MTEDEIRKLHAESTNRFWQGGHIQTLLAQLDQERKKCENCTWKDLYEEYKQLFTDSDKELDQERKRNERCESGWFAADKLEEINRCLREKDERISKLQIELEAEREKVLRAVRGEFTQVCSYCGWEAPPPSGWEKLEKHIQECPKHPLVKEREKVKKLVEAVEIHEDDKWLFDDIDRSLYEVLKQIKEG